MLEMRVSWELGLVIQFHVLMREFIGPPSLAIFSLEYNILIIEKRTKAKLAFSRNQVSDSTLVQLVHARRDLYKVHGVMH